MVLIPELLVAVGFWVSAVLFGGGPKIAKTVGLESCKTNCASKPYAVGAFRVGKETPSLGRFEK